MSVVIRFKRTGTKSRKQWRVVVADSRTPRNGQLLEELGFYNPLTNPPQLSVQMERYNEWVKKGARPSEAVRSGIRKEGKESRAN